MMFNIMVIVCVAIVVVRYRVYKKREANEIIDDKAVESLILEKIRSVLNTDDVDILEEEEWVWYKVRVGGVVYEVYMDDGDGDEIKCITHDTKVIYQATITTRVLTREKMRKTEKKVWMM